MKGCLPESNSRGERSEIRHRQNPQLWPRTTSVELHLPKKYAKSVRLARTPVVAMPMLPHSILYLCGRNLAMLSLSLSSSSRRRLLMSRRLSEVYRLPPSQTPLDSRPSTALTNGLSRQRSPIRPMAAHPLTAKSLRARLSGTLRLQQPKVESASSKLSSGDAGICCRDQIVPSLSFRLMSRMERSAASIAQ